MNKLWRAIRYLKLSSESALKLILAKAMDTDKNKASTSCLVEVNMLSRQIEDT
jgi:hypothetical protein